MSKSLPVVVRMSCVEAEALILFLSQRPTIWITEASRSGVQEPLGLCKRVSKAHAAAINQRKP
jgi:hypothetical protein